MREKRSSKSSRKVQSLKITGGEKKGQIARKHAILSQVSRRRGHNIAFAARIARLSMEEGSRWGGRRGGGLRPGLITLCNSVAGYALTQETVIRWQYSTLNRDNATARCRRDRNAP